MATLKDIAKELGVSIAAVSYVYNNKWREKRIKKSLAEKIRKKLKEENYRPNTLGLQLKTKKTQTIGVILGDLTRNFNLNILSGVEKVLAPVDYFTMVCNSNLGTSEKKHLQTLHARNVEGIILAPHRNGDTSRLLKELVQEKMPVILVDNYLPELRIDFVVTDNFSGSYQATKFLIDKGCKNIAYLGSRKNLSALKQRFNGYTEALKEKEVSLSKTLISRKTRESREVYSALEDIFLRERPDAIFVESLLYFKEGFRFLSEKRLSIPDDIALTGFDPVDLTLSEMNESHFHSLVKQTIPFVEQQGIRMGELAAQTLLRRITAKKRKVSQIFLKPNLKNFNMGEERDK